MKDEISLRDYRSTDLEAMFRLDEVCFAEAFRFDRESMRLFAEERGAIVLIAETDAGLAGFVIVHVTGRWGYVVTLDVAPESRRAGLAGKLMQEVQRRAAAAGAQWMGLHVFTGNEEAIRFYERMGYERGERKRRFYGAAGLDAFVYRRELG